MPGRVVDRNTYRKRYEDEVHKDGVPFFPDAAKKDMVAAGVVILVVLACAAVFGPYGPGGVPDPTIIDTAPAPDFYFLALYALFALLPPWTETVLLLVGPPLAIVLLFLVPFISGTGEKSWKRRPVAVLGVLLIVLTVTTLAWLGVIVPWSPKMEAWSAVPTPVQYVKGRGPSSSRERSCSRTSSAGTATAWAAKAASAAPLSTAWPPGSRGISSSARCSRAAATCPPTARTSCPPR